MTAALDLDIHDDHPKVGDGDRSMDNWFRKPPIQRQRWGDTQVLPHVNWGDIFFDLFYVVSCEAAMQLYSENSDLVRLRY